MFINFTNHPSIHWSSEQINTAEQYGAIVDIPFPAVSPQFSDEELQALANEMCQTIVELIGTDIKSSAVLCQGEYGLVFLITTKLQREKIKVLYAVSERIVNEVFENGISKKVVEFQFQGFREYGGIKAEEKETLMPSKYDSACVSDKERILLVPMGKGNYKITTYLDGDAKAISKTGYAFDAIVKKENPAKIAFIGTTESGWYGLLDWYSLANDNTEEFDGLKCKQIGTDKALFESFIKKQGNFNEVKIVLIPNGSNDDELVDYFDKLKDAVLSLVNPKKETEIIFDITNGFRSIPLYSMMLVKYIGLINNNKLSYRAYYGMYEASTREGTPLVDLTKVSELTEWINAISEFRNFGSVKELRKCLEHEQANDFNNKEIRKLVREIEEFDYGLNSNNLYYLEKGIKYLTDVDVEAYGLSKQAEMMILQLKAEFRERFSANTLYMNTYRLLKLSELYLEQGRVGAAAIALQESLYTYIMERYLKDEWCKREKLSAEKFEEKLFNHEARDSVKKHWDNKAYFYSNNKENIINYKSVFEFEQQYIDIKTSIRNVDAHMARKKYDADELYQLEGWMRSSIIAMLSDMQIPGYHSNCKLKFDSYFEDYWQEPSGDFRKLMNDIFSTDEVFSDWGKFEKIIKNNKQMLRELNITNEAITALHDAVKYVWNNNKKFDTVLENKIEDNKILNAVVGLWVESCGKENTMKEKWLILKGKDSNKKLRNAVIHNVPLDKLIELLVNYKK